MGLIRKAIFLGTAATGTPLVRWNSSQEAATKEQRRLMQEQNAILSDIAASRQATQFEEFDEDFLDYDDLPAEESRIKPGAKTVEPSLTDRLTEIKDLLDRGVITEEEHSAMRKTILGV